MDLQRIKTYKLSIMELRHLRYFVKVAAELHFGRAAEALGISQPPLSQQIRLLEQELGVQLFERSSRKVRLTTAGRLFLEEARTILAQADHAVRITQRAAAGEIGELTIGLSASTLYVPKVADAISAFHDRYPDVHLVFKELSIDAQREAVDGGALDIGFVRSRATPLLPDDVIGECIATDRMYAAMRKGHRLSSSDAPLDVEAIADEPMVHYPYDREGFLEDLHHLFGSVGRRPRLVQETHEMSTLLGLVSAGFGISVLPGSLRRLEVDTLHYRELTGDAALSSMWLLHRGQRASASARAFIRLLGAASVAMEHAA
jgi:DNA-binding transcriptional LysR family regulator